MIALIPQALLAFAAAGFPTARTTVFPTMALQPAHLDELPAMYRERWRWHEDAERSATAATFERAPVSAVAWEEEAAEACIITEDKEVLQRPTNTARARPPPPPSSAVTISRLPYDLSVPAQICGEMSFDSTDDGPVCIQDPTVTHSVRWVCA